MDERELFRLVEEAIMDGSLDEQMIIQYARLRDLSMSEISELETLLRVCTCGCTEPREECPEAGEGGIALNFDTAIHRCMGRREKCSHLVSTGHFDRLFDRWHEAVKDHFGGWENKSVLLEGEVYSHDREAEKYNVLLKDVELRVAEECRKVPKIWATVQPSEYKEANREHLSTGDRVTMAGKIEWDDHLHFYHLDEVTDLKVLRP